MLLLETAAEAPVGGDARSQRIRHGCRGQRRWPPLVAFVAMLAIHLRETPPVAEHRSLQVHAAAEVTVTQTTPFAISPDGRVLAFPAVGADGTARVWLQELGQARAAGAGDRRTFCGRAGGADVVARQPSIVYSHDQKLKRVDIDGGPPQRARPACRAGCWGRRGIGTGRSSSGRLPGSCGTGRIRRDADARHESGPATSR